ncbi:hypothetical protein ABPG75_008467 [Micractinium tetrahymenae]
MPCLGRLVTRCHDLSSASPGCSTPRTPRSPSAAITCSASSPRLPRRRWGSTPHAASLAAAEPTAPVTPFSADRVAPPAAAGAGLDGEPQTTPAAAKPLYDCVDVITQSLAVNLTLEEYKQLSSASLQGQVAAGGAPPAQAGAAAAAPATLSHLTLTSADLDSMGLCNHCRYPCYLSGMPACEASHYLQMWDADAPMKPRNFDSAAKLRLSGVADIAAVSSGGRANGRWKPDNQDSFLVQPTADGAGSEQPRAAAIGVFDGHGRLGASAAAIVRQAMADRLAALRAEEATAAAAGGLQGTAALLDGCFSAAEAAMEQSGRDFSKSGCTAVLALLDHDSVSVAWAGDSRAVLGVVDTRGTLMGAAAASGSIDGAASAAAAAASSASLASTSLSGLSDSYDGFVTPLCAAVPLTEDHKPDKPTELERITACGGRVTRLATDRFGNPAGPFRVFVPNCWSPGLALSRAFGDTLAGTVGVTSKPEVTVLPLPSPPVAEGDQALPGVSNAAAASCCSSDGGPPAAPAPERHVLIVASDGLWEWVSNTTAVAIASAAATAEDAAHALVEAAQKQWAVRYRGRNCDDVTVVVAFLER